MSTGIEVRAWEVKRSLPPELVEWITAGNETRSDPSDPYRGMCGALTRMKTPCRVAAGQGTAHKGVGRCSQHPLPEHAKGLAPWVGPIDREAWQELTGHNMAVAGVGFPREHGVGQIEKQSFGELMARHFDQEEREWWEGIPDDPLDRLEIAVRMRMIALGRINRQMARLRAMHNGRAPDNKVLSYELAADKISQTIARLEEARAKYLEMQSGNETRGMLRDVLRGLSDEEFAAMKSDPAALAALYNPNT